MDSAQSQQIPQEGTGKTGESLGVPADAPEATVGTSSPIVSGGAARRDEVVERCVETESRVESDFNDSVMSPGSVGSLNANVATATTRTSGKFWRPEKRPRSAEASQISTDSEDENKAAARKVPKSRDKQRVHSKTGTGRKQESRELLAAGRGRRRVGAEKCVERQPAETADAYPLSRASSLSASHASLSEVENKEPSRSFRDEMLQLVAIVEKVEQGSKNLKGTFKKHLKDAAAGFKDLGERVHRITASKENERLQRLVAEKDAALNHLKDKCEQVEAINSRMFAEMAELRKEMATLREEARQGDSERDRRLMVQLGTMMNARFEAVESRLLPEAPIRPSLTADNRKAVAPAISTSASNVEPAAKRKRSSRAAQIVPRQEPSVASRPLEEVVWTRVSRKDNRSINAALAPKTKAPRPIAPAPKPKTPKAKRDPKLRPPRSAAVVLTLQPGSEERGTTYAAILTRAKEAISISELGIPALKIRRAATGARILEVPGATSGDKADLLAQKLREVLSADSVRVARPEKCADMRISGLDDSATVDEVVMAVARIGECSVEAIKAGAIRCTSQGKGTLFIRCPVPAAKKVADSRLLVGWVSAQVRILPTRAMRCFRCLEVGHVRVQCTSEIDRSDECFRCGQKGHKSAGCSANPHCSVCAALGQPADHRAGAKSCKATKHKKRRMANNVQTAASGTTTAASATSIPLVASEEVMEMV